jgi:hypothetical protein
MASEIRNATVPVIDDLNALAVEPDVIHGHHHLELMTALLQFPRVPAVFVCHDRLAWHDVPPHFPRILRYVAVDDNCRDRLISESGVSVERVRVLLNAVDLERFLPRGPLPARPRKALVFSNLASEQTYLQTIRQACSRSGISVDVIGQASGHPCARPEEVLGRYDLVFAKARCALEALAVGTAVILCDLAGVGPLVQTTRVDQLRRLNLGRRTLTEPVRVEVILREIARYDARDAEAVSRRIRTSAGLDQAVDDLLALYREVVAEQRSLGPWAPDVELRAVATYLRRVMPLALLRDPPAQALRARQECLYWQREGSEARQESERWQAEARRAEQERERWQTEAIRTLEDCEHWRRESGRAEQERDCWQAEALREAQERERWQSRCRDLEAYLSALQASLTLRLRRWIERAARRIRFERRPPRAAG